MLKVEFGLARTGTTSIYQVDFNDVSEYVRNVSVSRGKSSELSSYDAGSANVQLSNENRLFDPSYAASPYASAIAPTGVVRISQDGIQLFIGLITDWNFTYDQSGDAIAEIQATDAFWLLSNLIINERTPQDGQTSTQRIQTILQLPEVGWSLNDTDLSIGAAVLGGDSSEYIISQGSGVLEYLQSIEQSEVGRLFIGKDGKLIFKSRLDDIFALNYSYTRNNLSTNPSFENDVVGWSGSVSRDTSYYYYGSSCGSIAANSTIEQFFNAQSNGTYTCSFWARASTDTSITLSASQSYNGTSWEALGSKDFTVTAADSRTSYNYKVNPNFKLSNTGFSGATRVANNEGIGGYVGEVTSTFTMNDGSYFLIPWGGLISGGGTSSPLNFSAMLRGKAGSNGAIRATILWYGVTGNYIGSSVIGTTSVYDTGWTPVSGFAYNPSYFDTFYSQAAYARYFSVVYDTFVGMANGYYVRSGRWGAGATVDTFEFDPDLGRTDTFLSQWNGSPYGSYSQYQGWKRYSITFTLDADYLNGKFAIKNNALSGFVQIDAVMIEASPTLEPYFDGSNGEADKVVDGVTYTYTESWNL